MQNGVEFKKLLKNGRSVIGPFVRMAEPAVLEIIGYSGFDFCIIDLEHGPMGVYQAENLVRTAKGAGLSPLIRVRSNDQSMILRALDTGADGVQVPQVNSAEMAGKSVSSAKFYPQGERGVCRFTRAAHYSDIPKEEYFAQANANSVVVLQIEGAGGVQDIDRIVEIQGYDVLFLGPYDLSQALGLTGQVTHPRVLDTIEQIARKARDKGIAVGSFADTADNIKRQIDMGVQFLATYIDAGILYESARERVGEIRSLLNNKQGGMIKC